MLKLNLLPPERQRLRRTPLYALVPLVLAIALVFGGIAMFAIWWVEKELLDKELAHKLERKGTVEEKKKTFDQLQNEIQQVRSQVREILQVARRDVEWGEVVKAIVDVSSKNSTLWFDEIRILEGSQAASIVRGAGPGQVQVKYAVELKCNVAPEQAVEGDKVEYKEVPEPIMKVRTDFKQNPVLRALFSDVLPLAPEWKRVTTTAFKEGFWLSFPVYLVATR